MARQPHHYVAEVRGQYEELPYPFVDVAMEREQFCASDSYCLDALNHYGWGGRRDLRVGTRFLVAGAGTGDMPVFFAEQLRGSDAEIVAIDLSEASIAIAKARLKKRGLTNVTFHHMSLLDLPSAGLGKFDVVECGGVLHHLADPDAGLHALTSVLADDGLLAVMLYGQYGRMAVYMIQELMRRMMPPDTSRAERIEATRAFVTAMPRSHWFAEQNARYINDIQWPDGSGIYDLFLHSHDRAYTVPQIYDFIAQAGLTLTSFFDEQVGDMAYMPELYTQDPKLHALLRDKPIPERHAIAELMHGSMNKHHFFAAKHPKPIASYDDDCVLVWAILQATKRDWVPDMQAALAGAVPGAQVPAHEKRHGMPPMRITNQKYTGMLLGLIDGNRTAADIVAEVAAVTGEAPHQVRAQFSLLYRELFNNKRIFIRHVSIPPYITYGQIEQRLKTIPEIL